MATPALVVDKETVFDAPLNSLLGCLHHLCRKRESKENCLFYKAWMILKAVVLKKKKNPNKHQLLRM